MMASLAWAQAGGGPASEGPATLLSLVPFLLIFVIFYFLLIRPQQQRQKQQREMLEALKKGDKVTLVGFGTFSVSRREARQGRNPQTGKTIKIPATNVAKFKAGSKLSDAIN